MHSEAEVDMAVEVAGSTVVAEVAFMGAGLVEAEASMEVGSELVAGTRTLSRRGALLLVAHIVGLHLRVGFFMDARL